MAELAYVPQCLDYIVGGLTAAANPAFGTEVSTEGRTPTEVADTVLRLLTADDRPR